MGLDHPVNSELTQRLGVDLRDLLTPQGARSRGTLIDAAQWPEARPGSIPGPLLTDPLSDPIMHMRHMSSYTLKGGRDGRRWNSRPRGGGIGTWLFVRALDGKRGTHDVERRRSRLGSPRSILMLALAVCVEDSLPRRMAELIRCQQSEPDRPSRRRRKRELRTTGEIAWAQFGSPLAVSGDLLVVGAPGDLLISPSIYAGAAYVFERNPSTNEWVEKKRIVPHDTTTFFSFGRALAVDGDTEPAVSMPTGLNALCAERRGLPVRARSGRHRPVGRSHPDQR